METVKLSIKELGKKVALIRTNFGAEPGDKLGYAAKRIIGRIEDALRPAQLKHNETVQDNNVNFASTDERGNLILNGDNYAYTKVNAIALRKANEASFEAFNQTVLEVEPYALNINDSGDWDRYHTIAADVKEELKDLFPEA